MENRLFRSSLLATAFVLPFLFSSCGNDSKKKKEDPEPTQIVIDDVADLSANLSSPGLVRKQGDIPAPATSGYGHDFQLITNQIILTPANTFDFEIANPGQAYVMFIKFEGTDEYMQITVDGNGSVVERSANNTQKHCMCIPPGQCIGLPVPANPPVINNNFTAPATVQIFQPPLQANVPDLSFLNDIQFWSPPKQVSFKCFGSGTGDVFTTLTWNKTGDIDLWLKEPNGNTIMYSNKVSSTGGKLDFDNTQGYGPENIFFEDQAPAGNYEIWVDYYGGSAGPVDCVISSKIGNESFTDKVTLTTVKEKKLVRSFTR